ncbi:MAG: hypothetical protein IJE12_05120 [Prevotella sp.]|nr:hypothetical protein [Prevotella sp.]
MKPLMSKFMLKTKLLQLFFLLSLPSVFSYAHKVGDYIEINGVPAFIFYVDDSQEHGLAMSLPAMDNKEIGKLIKKKLLSEEQAKVYKTNVLDFDNYKKAGLDKKDAKKSIFTELIPLLGDDGEKNATAIKKYCSEKGYSMQTYFPWEHWAEQLGDGWFIPGDKELALFAQFYTGGLGGDYTITGSKFYKKGSELSDNELIKRELLLIAYNGLISSSVHHADAGFRKLQYVTNKFSKGYLDIYDIQRKKSEDDMGTCAVHTF